MFEIKLLEQNTAKGEMGPEPEADRRGRAPQPMTVLLPGTGEAAGFSHSSHHPSQSQEAAISSTTVTMEQHSLLLLDDDSLISKTLKSEEGEELDCSISEHTLLSVSETTSIRETLVSDDDSRRSRTLSRDGPDSFISSDEDSDRRQLPRQPYMTYAGIHGDGRRRPSSSRSPMRSRSVRSLTEASGGMAGRTGLRGRPMMGYWPPPPTGCYPYGPSQARPAHWLPFEFYEGLEPERQGVAAPQMMEMPWDGGRKQGPREERMGMASRDEREEERPVSDSEATEGDGLSNARNIQGQSPLHLAAAAGFVEGVTVLVR